MATKSAVEDAEELWEMVQTALSEFVITGIMLIITFNQPSDIFLVYSYNAKYSCMPKETRISLNIMATNFRLERTATYLYIYTS